MKKLLALVLALVMTLGLATVGANAADFKDESSIEYAEAVNVMSGIGVIQGDDNGNFNPKGTLTREQAAKIVAYMLLGKTGADSLSASGAPFSDVAADRWSAGAISYCANEGIIAGLGDGTFNPAGLLTGHQFAKMLLVALGYDAKLEGMQGTADWAVNVAKLAVSADLEEDLSIVMSQNITRDQAAMMAFNTLKSDMVDYENGVNVKTSDGTDVTVNAKRYKVDELRGGEYDSRTTNINIADVDKFCEVYFPDLKKVESTNDFNEPTNQWSFKNTTVSEEAKEADKVLVGTVTYQDLYNAAGSAAMNSVRTINIYVDGKLMSATNTLNGVAGSTISAEAAGKFWSKDNDENLAWTQNNASTSWGTTGAIASALGEPTGNGTITSVFVKSVSNTTWAADRFDININIKHIYAAKVNSVTEASGSDARKVSVTAKTQPSQTNTAVTFDGDFETTEFKKDDIVFCTVAVNASNEAKIQSMELATLVSGAEVTKTSIEGTKPNKSVVTAGGKDYKLNINVKAEDRTGFDAIKSFDAGDKFDLYLDANGLIVYAEKTEEELDLNRYLVLTRGALSTGTGSNPVADAITLAGNKLTSINITKLEDKDLKDWGTIWTDTSGTTPVNHTLELYQVYKYTVKGSDYELEYPSGSYSDDRLADVTYTAGKAVFTGMTGTLTGNTKLYSYDMTDSGVKTYNGVTNFPSIKNLAGTPSADGAPYGGEPLMCADETGTGTDTKFNAISTVGAGHNYTNTLSTAPATALNAVATLVKNGNVLAAVVVYNSRTNATVKYANVSASTGAADVIYVTSKNYTTTKSGDDTVYTFDVIKEGKVTTVSTIKGGVRDTLKGDQDLYIITAYDGEYADAVTQRSFRLNGIGTASGTTSWGRDTISKDTDTTTTTIECGTSSGIYSVSVDVVSGTFKVETNNENGSSTATYGAWATDSNTKFFEITSAGKVTEVDASNFTYDNLTEGEFSVVYDTNDETLDYVFYQKV